MIIELGGGLVAGVLTTLSPCVLPLLPIILAAALDRHPLGPLALAAGLALSYAGIGVGLLVAGAAVGLQDSVVRATSAVLLGVFGVVLLSTALQQRFAVAGGMVTDRLSPLLGRLGSGVGAQFLLGVLLGAVWVPCVGPTLGAAIGLAARGESLVSATLTMASFALGAVVPLLLLAYGSRRALAARKGRMAAVSRAAKPVFGASLLLVAVLVASGTDRRLEAWLLEAMPGWWLRLTTAV